MNPVAQRNLLAQVIIDSELGINPCEEKIDHCALDEHNEEAFLKLS